MLHFENPWLLLLGLLAAPLVALGWRALSLADPLRRAVALALRAILLLALVVALAGPQRLQQHDQLTVIGLLDISGSVQRFANLSQLSLQQDTAATQPATRPVLRSNIEYLREWFRTATNTRTPDDRFGLIVFDGQAVAVSAPTRSRYVDDNLDAPIAQGTNIADAVRLGVAMFPPDSAKRLVLVTDGNETAGSVLEAVRQAAAGATASKSEPSRSTSSIPVDVLPITYRVTGDVQVARVEAPPAAQPGQKVTVRIVLESASATGGRLTLNLEGTPVDLNGSQPGDARMIDVPAGPSVQLAQVTLGQTPINRFEASFEPDIPLDDALPDNNRAEAFTATPGKGTVLVLDTHAGRESNPLAAILTAAGIPTQTQRPAALPDNLLSLQNYDLVILDNVAAYELVERQKQMLAKYVNDLGGGLIMVGGDNSFGAGGWTGTAIADILPLNLEPSRQLRLPSAALVLVMDKSGSMNDRVAGARASKQQIATEAAALAIESLRPDSMVGVVAFDTSPDIVVPLQPNDVPRKISAEVRAITAEGGTSMGPALLEALEMLKNTKVAKKRIVCLTDGRSMSADLLPGIAQQLAANDIQLTTIAVGDDADDQLLEKLSKIGGGEFYAVRDPRLLPRVLVDSVQVINKPLLRDITFVPRVLPTGSTLTAGMDAAPPLGGLVITSPRDEPTVSLEMVDPDGEPLLAHWQAGLGRVAAFTSDVRGKWSSRWTDWPNAATFWAQLVRSTSRPPMNPDAELVATIQDEHLNIALEMTGPVADDQSFNDLQVDGAVYSPDGSSTPVRLRQAAPGRYLASVDAKFSGNYIVALNPRHGTRRLAPVIGGISRSTSPEFRKYQSNLALLEEIVEETRGRRLDIERPLAANLFDREGMPPSVSLLPFWRSILLWSLAILLLDVACRRIAWNQRLLRGALSRAIAKVRPASVRGREVAATLATLRSVSDQVDRRHEADAEGIAKFRASGRIMPPPVREPVPAAPASVVADANETPSTPINDEHKPDASKIAAALDVLLGSREFTPASPPSTKPTAPANADGALDTTSNLLAAKRRARRQLDGSDPGQSR